jgi:hypothetical protein
MQVSGPFAVLVHFLHNLTLTTDVSYVTHHALLAWELQKIVPHVLMGILGK